MGYKIMINKDTAKCPSCDYTWNKQFGLTDLSFNEKEKCLCCPNCGKLIEDGDDNH